MVKLLEDWRIKTEQEKIALLKWPEDWRIGGFRKKTALLKWPEDWRIQEFLGEKITLFKITGGLEDSR